MKPVKHEDSGIYRIRDLGLPGRRAVLFVPPQPVTTADIKTRVEAFYKDNLPAPVDGIYRPQLVRRDIKPEEP